MIGYAYDISDIFQSASCIYIGTGKRRSIYYRQDLLKTSCTIQMLQLSNAIRPEDDSCMDKVKESTPG